VVKKEQNFARQMQKLKSDSNAPIVFQPVDSGLNDNYTKIRISSRNLRRDFKDKMFMYAPQTVFEE
jgi:hypothetical protein